MVSDAVAVMDNGIPDEFSLGVESVASGEVSDTVDISPMAGQNGARSTDDSDVWQSLDGDMCLLLGISDILKPHLPVSS